MTWHDGVPPLLAWADLKAAGIRDEQAAGQPETLGEALAALRERFPDWRFWYVLRVIGHTVWCARRGPVLLNEDSPEWLAEAIEEADAEAAAR